MIAVFDRNISDITIAKILTEKIRESGFNSLTSEEKTQWNTGLRGCLNYADLNRIEGNCRELLDALNISGATKTNWKAGDFIRQSDMERILGNIRAIRNKQYINVDTPQAPDHPINHYEKLNDMERILFDAYEVYQAHESIVDYVDELYIDEEIGVL